MIKLTYSKNYLTYCPIYVQCTLGETVMVNCLVPFIEKCIYILGITPLNHSYDNTKIIIENRQQF